MATVWTQLEEWEPLLLMQRPFQQPVEPSSWVQVASRQSEWPEVWIAFAHLGQLERASVVGLAVVAGNLVALAESHHSQETVQEGSLAQDQETSQAVVDRMALGESHQGLTDHHGPIHQEDPGGRTQVGIVGDDRKEGHLGAQDLAAESQKEVLVVDLAEEVGFEAEDETRSVCDNLSAQRSFPQITKVVKNIGSKSEGRQRKSPHGFALSESI
jgi:hypothetical protein